MNLTSKTKTLSLDWDNIDEKTLKSRLFHLTHYISEDGIGEVTSLFFRSSASKKGYHIRIAFSRPVPEARTRFAMGDDSRRILLDMFRKAHINNITWDVKGNRKAGKWQRVK